MSRPLIRPEALELLRPWWEVALTFVLAGFGGWFIWLGGYFLGFLGALILSIAVFWGLLARRKMKFVAFGRGVGMVEVIEGQITYFAPQEGGVIGLSDLIEIRMSERGGQRHWHLVQSNGAALSIPLSALGAERLFDAFTALPGLDSIDLVRALEKKFLKVHAEPRVHDPLAKVTSLPNPFGQVRFGPVIWRKHASLVVPFRQT